MKYSYSGRPLDTPEVVQQELREIEQALREPTFAGLQLDVLHAAPGKYAEGMIVYADGTDWNPGSGEGVYVRTSAAWVKL